ncbi:MAG: SDR family oxidoreductase [Halofilum sp. (in: g-proteobacteria)]
MAVKLKPLDRQTIVITGATSGIGLVTGRQVARAGARLVLAARSREALRDLTAELRAEGAQVVYAAADVGREDDVQAIADVAAQHFGGFDTWINNAAVSIYGGVEEVSIEDQRQLFETNYWGTVLGSRVACAQLRERGGKLINVGSALSERAIPLQGIYSASKAAVMGFTDALRMELEQDGAPISVTLVKPGSVDTPYQDRAANYTGAGPRNPPPVYDPSAVARAILHATTHHRRDVVVGAGGKAIMAAGTLAPRLTDRVMERFMPGLERTSEPRPGTEKRSLYRPAELDLVERGGYSRTFGRSLYTAAGRHKLGTAAAAVAAVGAGAMAYRYGSARSQRH